MIINKVPSKSCNTSISLILNFIPLKRQQTVISWIIDGLQLRHSFFPPKRLDVKTPLQSIERYLKSMYN